MTCRLVVIAVAFDVDIAAQLGCLLTSVDKRIVPTTDLLLAGVLS